MILEGVVTNVAAFGAFVDIGVHQDGLVHVSALSNRSSRIRTSVVKAGADRQGEGAGGGLQRKRIALTMRLSDSAPPAGRKRSRCGARVRSRRAPGP